MRIVEQRFYDGFEVLLIISVNLGSDTERHSSLLRDFDRLVQSFFRRHPAEKGQVFTSLVVEWEALFLQTVVDGALPIYPRQRFTLRVGN